MEENVNSNSMPARPLGFMLTLILTGLMTYRIAVVFQWGELGISIPEVWSIPFSGDFFVGIFAPIVTYLLWKRRGLLAWTAGIVFHVVGIKDFSVAGQLMFIEPGDMMPSTTFGIIFMSVGIGLQLLCIGFLVLNRDYYLRHHKR